MRKISILSDRLEHAAPQRQAMDRRRARLFLVTLVLLAAPCCAATPEQPNIVFVLADDLGYGDLGCFGQNRFTTPRLDALAAEGIRLTQHYAGSTVCAPSRCALMTGLHTGHCAIRGNKEIKPTGQLPLPAEAVTLAERLKAVGYTTGAFGKWGLGPPGSEGGPLAQGFDEFFGYNCQRKAHRYYPDYLFDGDEKRQLDGETYSPELITERALDFISRHRRKPFFCFLPVTIPHAAMEGPEAEREPFRKRFPQFEHTVGKYAGASSVNPVASFAAMVTRLDSDVGRLVDLLDELGLTERTLIVFTSDNGPHVEGGHNPKFFNSNGPFRGFKRDLYEGGLRVPTLARWPGSVASGAESDVVSAGWDWLPTLCELAGAEVPEDIDGVSLAPTLTGRGEQFQHDHLYWEFHPLGGRQAVRRGPWKAIRLNVESDRDRTPELYHLPTDPGERRNLATERPDVLAEMVTLMDSARRPSPLFDFGSDPPSRDATDR